MQTLKVELPDTTIELLPVPRTKLAELRGHLVDIAGYWFGAGFSIGEAVLDDGCWEAMSGAIAMLPRKDNPSMGWVDLDLLANDYSQLEKIFLAQSKDVKWTIQKEGNGFYSFDPTKYEPGEMIAMHRFNAMGILREALT